MHQEACLGKRAKQAEMLQCWTEEATGKKKKERDGLDKDRLAGIKRE
jgi:hypothetical protein